MLILEKLVKCHYEIHGRYEKSLFSDMLSEYAKKRGMNEIDAYYNLLGYKHDNEMTAAERHECRSMFYNGNKKQLMTKFRVKNGSQLVEVLKRMDCIGDKGIPSLENLSLDEESKSVVRLLSHYFLNSEDKALQSANGLVLFKDFMKNYRYLKNKKELEAVVSSENFSKAMSVVMPRIVVKKGSKPCISSGVLFLSKQYSPADLQYIVNVSVMQALTRILDVPEQIYFFVVRNAITYSLDNRVTYMEMLDYAHSLNCTVKELFNLCGLKHVDVLKYYEETGCTFHLFGDDKFVVIGKNSVNENDRIIISSKQISDLFRYGALKTLNWDKEGPWVFVGEKTYLKQLYKQNGQFDYTGGIA